MLDLNDMRERAVKIRRDGERGYTTVPTAVALSDLVTPLLQLIEAMESTKADRWLTLEEVTLLTGWKRKYFDKRLASLGGRSRLDVWAEGGQAEKAMPGIWLISPARVPARKPGYVPPPLDAAPVSGRAVTAAPGPSKAAPDPESIAETLTA